MQVRQQLLEYKNALSHIHPLFTAWYKEKNENKTLGSPKAFTMTPASSSGSNDRRDFKPA